MVMHLTPDPKETPQPTPCLCARRGVCTLTVGFSSYSIERIAAMGDKSANTPKPAKPAGKAAKKAADASTQDGLQATRENTNSREEVRQQNVPERGQTK
jgi:hypothetical protein